MVRFHTERKKEKIRKRTFIGMGLYLCKKLCTRLNLNISIVSEEKKYTKISIIFPNSSLHKR